MAIWKTLVNNEHCQTVLRRAETGSARPGGRSKEVDAAVAACSVAELGVFVRYAQTELEMQIALSPRHSRDTLLPLASMLSGAASRRLGTEKCCKTRAGSPKKFPVLHNNHLLYLLIRLPPSFLQKDNPIALWLCVN
jgi:hypothetical protein